MRLLNFDDNQHFMNWFSVLNKANKTNTRQFTRPSFAMILAANWSSKFWIKNIV